MSEEGEWLYNGMRAGEGVPVAPSVVAFIRIALPEMRITLQKGTTLCAYGDPAAQVGRLFHGSSLAAFQLAGVFRGPVARHR